MKVISFMDNDGYVIVIDVTYPRDRINVFRDILLEALEIEGVSLTTPGVQHLLSQTVIVQQTGNENDINKVIDDIIEYLDDIDFPCAGFGHNGLNIITPSTTWPKGSFN